MTITITRAHEPFTEETWIIESHTPVVANDDDPIYIKKRAAEGWVNVTGRIVNSTTVNRVWGHSSVRRDPDKPLSDQMPARYLKDGAHYITVAM